MHTQHYQAAEQILNFPFHKSRETFDKIFMYNENCKISNYQQIRSGSLHSRCKIAYSLLLNEAADQMHPSPATHEIEIQFKSIKKLLGSWLGYQLGNIYVPYEGC